MKLLIHSEEGAAFFDLLEAVPGLEVVTARTAEEAVALAGDIDVFYGRPTPELVAAAPRLRFVQAPSAGVDFLMKYPEFIENDIALANTRGAHAPSIAEHAFALLLALTRCIVPTTVEWQRQKHWGRGEAYRLPKEVMGSTMGILGFGAIGRAIAQRALGFGMTVRAVDVVACSGEPYCEEVWASPRLHDMLAVSDVLAVAAPYTRESHHALDAAAFTAMPRGSYVIAVSRGGIIDEAALVGALRSGHLTGAGLDVTEREPLPADSPLWELPNVVITPHLAGSSAQKERRCVEILVENLQRLSRGDELINVVDKRRGY